MIVKLKSSRRFVCSSTVQYYHQCVHCSITVELYIAPNNSYGRQDEAGNWDGLIGELVSHRADFGVGGILITAEVGTCG